ncbi:MFS general substrate transporter [Westerdykella ornata]|uniref:MFS general substrate transporter n=1 Tax=Westerdykella ornata TaxID=318751 RepID=A0A6A6JV57_WESOR|nr:MFS general substrate transporter [Westerdykella ornata]KAF2279626.1 MFS general substrate transporter [Westerdykella ornata]
MAYTLFKYARRKYKEKHTPTVDDSHLLLGISTDQRPERENQELVSPPPNLEEATPAPDVLSPEEKARIKREASERRKHRWKLILGLLLPNFLAAVDATIVAPAVPSISSHFNRLGGSFNWIVAAYTLTYTTFVPSSGQIADVYGRHAALQFHMFFILIGSVFCAAAATWPMLLFGRALQGVGAAGITNLTHIVLSDNVSLADNSKNNTIFSLVNGISFAVGPVIGGYLTSASWRYCFILPIPVAFVSMVLIYLFMRRDLVRGRLSPTASESRRTGYLAGIRTFDWPGMILFILGIGLIILALMWAGPQYAWNSAAVIAPLVLGGVMSAAFFLHEYLLGPGRFTAKLFPNQLAMMPSTLFRKKDTALLMTINFATGVSLVSAFYFISYYFQFAEGYSASKAGVQLLYYTPGLGVGVYVAMYLCNIWPRQTYYTLFAGSIIEGLGLALLAWAVSSRQKALVNGMLALSGVGTGLRFMPVILHAAGIWPDRIPAIQSLLSFVIAFGETLGISIMASVFSNKYQSGLHSIIGNSSGAIHGPPSLEVLAGLPAEQRLAVEDLAAKAVMWAFIAVLPIMGLSIVAALCLGNVWIGKAPRKGQHGTVASEETKGYVLYGLFLWSLLRRTAKRDREEVEIKRYEDEQATSQPGNGKAAVAS